MSPHDRIRSLRKQRGLSQTQMAEALGISRTTYINFEAGRTKLYSENLSLFAQHFALSEQQILFGEAASSDILNDNANLSERLRTISSEYEQRINDLLRERNSLLEQLTDIKETLKHLQQTNSYLLRQLDKD